MNSAASCQSVSAMHTKNQTRASFFNLYPHCFEFCTRIRRGRWSVFDCPIITSLHCPLLPSVNL